MSEQMKPGHELDAVPEGITDEAWADYQFNSDVAERVMSWRAAGGRWLNSHNEMQYYTYDFDPKHNIAHAWQVVERLAALGWSTHVTVQDDGKRICHCTVWEEDEDDGEMDLVAMTEYMESDSASHAICLVALEVMEIIEAG